MFAVDRASLNRALLARQLLLERSTLAPLAAIEQLFAMQAQLARPPFVGLWARVAGYCREDLHALLAAKKVVRATSLRGTLHLMSTRDYRDHRLALQPMLTAAVTTVLRERAEGLEARPVCVVAHKFLSKQPATFDEIRAKLVKKFPQVNDRALGFAVRMLLPLVQVPVADERWAFPGAAAFSPAGVYLDGVLKTTTPHGLVRRYLAAFGPATVADAQTWSGVPKLAPIFDDLRGELVTAKDGKRELFDLPDAPRPAAKTVAPVRFIPEFDNLVLGHADRSRLIDDEYRGKVTTKNLQVKATVLVDGRVAGTWTLDRKKATATVTVELFAPIAAKHRAAITAEGKALATFVEPDATSVAVSVR